MDCFGWKTARRSKRSSDLTENGKCTNVTNRRSRVGSLIPFCTTIVNQKINFMFANLGILTARTKKRRIIYRTPPWEICTCSMLTVTVLLLNRKLIPPWYFPWCDNVFTLGCRWILFFLCFTKVKNRRVVRTFQVPSWQPLDQIGWNSERMLSAHSPTKPCLWILIIPLIKNLCRLLHAVLFFLSSNFILV